MNRCRVYVTLLFLAIMPAAVLAQPQTPAASKGKTAPEPFEVGCDSVSKVSADYKDKGEFPFTGTIDKISFEVKK